MKLVGQFTPAEVAEMEVEKAGEQLLTDALLGTTAGEPTQAAPVEQVSLKERAEALGAFIRAGVVPVDAARLVGLDTDVDFIDALPITLKPNNLLAAETDATQAKI